MTVTAAICDLCDDLCFAQTEELERQRCHDCDVPVRILTLAELREWLRRENEANEHG
jgi:hypothetical protein